jgi:LysR family positive regulator for ilvC
MDIRELKLFLHLTTTLHFGKTSRACNITRSGLTRTIQRLENELGEQLFIRNNRSVRLTESGRLFREYASDVVQRYRTLQSQFIAGTHLRGELSLYCSVTAILSILPTIINKFRVDHPDINLNLSTGDAAMAIAKLENGEVDVTIAALPEQLPPHIVFAKLLETPLIFIVPRSSEEDQPSIEHWAPKGVIMPERGLSRIRCERWFAEKRMNPEIYSYVAGNEALIAMVAMGCGIGVVPRLVLENSPLQNRVKTLEVEPALKPFTVGLCTTRNNHRNPIVKAFWQIAERESDKTPGENNEHDPDNK